jgi:Transposase zinc-binding domain
VLTDIAQCRTAALGGHLEHCDACGFAQAIHPSCRNRHCPKCQALAQEKWIARQQERMLDVTHFHVVFTLPAELGPLAKFGTCYGKSTATALLASELSRLRRALRRSSIGCMRATRPRSTSRPDTPRGAAPGFVPPCFAATVPAWSRSRVPRNTHNNKERRGRQRVCLQAAGTLEWHCEYGPKVASTLEWHCECGLEVASTSGVALRVWPRGGEHLGGGTASVASRW